ncbi:MAG: exodeoxyribonuclease III [Proteobacteria bacterium SG_bin7]|nr:MAG: exodeoxyribonuclease III [Proteobacteria bacterium SG_bin7]
MCMKLASWNVNGIRSVSRYGFADWLDKEAPDVLCIQESKAQQEQIDDALIKPAKYNSVWHSAIDKGYSGVTTYFKKEPLEIISGIKDEEIDSEGRVLTLEFKDFHLVNSYFPNSGREHDRLPFKLDFCEKILKFIKNLEKKKPVLICGDFNIAHREIDLANPKTNQKNAGFLPEERAWMENFLKQGYIDVFRNFNRNPGFYTWWSYRPGVRERNIGWRLDYFCASPELRTRLKDMTHLTEVKGSDHCPIILSLK